MFDPKNGGFPLIGRKKLPSINIVDLIDQNDRFTDICDAPRMVSGPTKLGNLASSRVTQAG